MSAESDADDGAAGLNVLCQAELGEGATLSHIRVQAESERAVLLTSTLLGQRRDSERLKTSSPIARPTELVQLHARWPARRDVD